jgi:prevent-host-death family protein
MQRVYPEKQSMVKLGIGPKASTRRVVALCPYYDYILVMTVVNVATLKEKLSYYLKLVREGREIVVTSHRHRVARIVPASAELEVAAPSLPVKALAKVKGVKRRNSESAVKALLDDRRRR